MLDVGYISSAVTGTSTASYQSAASSGAMSSSVIATSPSNVEFVMSAIRVDNLQNVAILEYRSATTGEVERQYPTQKQIEAFRYAQRLQARKVTSAPSEGASLKSSAPTVSTASSGTAMPSVAVYSEAVVAVASGQGAGADVSAPSSSGSATSSSILV